MLTIDIGFVGRRFQKKYCQIHHAIISAILEAIFQKMAAFFQSNTSYLGRITSWTYDSQKVPADACFSTYKMASPCNTTT